MAKKTGSLLGRYFEPVTVIDGVHLVATHGNGVVVETDATRSCCEGDRSPAPGSSYGSPDYVVRAQHCGICTGFGCRRSHP